MIEAAHTGPHGISQKSSDLSAIPLCRKHHRTGDDSYHKLGPRKFAEVHRLNIRAIVARLSTKPLIRVESGTFVGWLGDKEYLLGSTDAGLARAIRRMNELRREIEAEVARGFEFKAAGRERGGSGVKPLPDTCPDPLGGDLGRGS